mmetsp:Transcript_18880/g.37901  ORF Transcript_18880/g.37901 Transcript_18880/m.37901 type:complete len:104 (+) Transcript_18880:447-758(+)
MLSSEGCAEFLRSISVKYGDGSWRCDLPLPVSSPDSPQDATLSAGVSFFCLITRSEVPFSRFPVNHQNQSPSISSSSPANAIGTFGSIRFILPSMNGVSSDSD